MLIKYNRFLHEDLKSMKQIIYIYIYIYIFINWPTCQWVKCLPMAQETRVQSQVEHYQRHKRWYLIPPGLTFSIIRYISRVKRSNPGNGVASSLHLGEKYFKMSRFTKTFVFFQNLFCSYIMYVSGLLLSSENIYGTRPC